MIEKLKENRRFIFAFIIIFLLIAIGWSAYLRIVRDLPWADWTGFGEYTGSIPKENRPKTLWDFLGLIIVPVMLAVGVYWLNQQQKKRDNHIETER